MADLEQPLLRNRKVYPDCPGCKVAQRAAASKSPPYAQLLFVALIVFCNAMPTTSLFPYVYFMVKDFNIAARDEDIGIYAGLLGSSFMFGRFLSAWQWGIWSDKYGRRPIILIGLASIAIFNLLFGASYNYWMALTCRLLLGLLNGSFGPAKVFASEVCNERQQALSVSVVGTSWGLGLIIGPAIGGYLARPSLSYPDLFPPGSFFDRYPYLLPSVVAAATATVGALITTQLPETLHFHENAPKLAVTYDDEGKRADAGLNDEDIVPVSDAQTIVEQSPPKAKKSPWAMFKNYPLLASIYVFSIWALFEVSFTECFSFWALSPKSIGGLGFTSVQVGNILTVSGFGLLFWQLFVFPPVTNYLGPSKVIRLSAILALPTMVLFPLAGQLVGAPTFLLILLISLYKNIASTSTMDGAFLLVNNAVKPSERGAANGLAVSTMALTTTIAPETGGLLFSWALSRNSDFLPGPSLVFFVLGLVIATVVCWTWSPFWPLSLDKGKHEEDDEGPGPLS